MRSRLALSVYFPLQESLASDVDRGVVRLCVSISTIIVSPWPLAYSISPLVKTTTTSHSRHIVEVSCMLIVWLFGFAKQTCGFLMT
jgi:hypothetical protein